MVQFFSWFNLVFPSFWCYYDSAFSKIRSRWPLRKSTLQSNMRSPGEFLSGEFLKVKYTRRLSTEYLPELSASGGCRVLLKALLRNYYNDTGEVIDDINSAFSVMVVCQNSQLIYIMKRKLQGSFYIVDMSIVFSYQKQYFPHLLRLFIKYTHSEIKLVWFSRESWCFLR